MPVEYPSEPRVAVGAVVVRDGRVLLVERGKSPSSGMWAVPGGSVELGESLAQAVEREVMEETGVTVLAGDVVHAFDAVVRDQDGRVRFHYVIVDLEAAYVAGEAVAAGDASDARWFRSSELDGVRVHPVTLELVRRLLEPARGDRSAAD
ncbi:MAG TPA: NUDIX hydrolase [Candidatus Binatia bacterium]|nr:NUDIX hydrolase [Candidatus Binatia bacterium]